MQSHQLFLSHTWKYDESRRDTHLRVMQLCNLIKEYGWTVWLDEEQIRGNIDYSMVNGVRNCEIFIVCLTKQYIKKINRASANARIRDNCYKEWIFANSMNKYILPVILEPEVLQMKDKGVIDLILGNTFYVDLSGDITEKNIKELHKTLLKCDTTPINKKQIDTKARNFITFCNVKNKQIDMKARKFMRNLFVFNIAKCNKILSSDTKNPNILTDQYRTRKFSKSLPNIINL